MDELRTKRMDSLFFTKFVFDLHMKETDTMQDLCFQVREQAACWQFLYIQICIHMIWHDTIISFIKPGTTSTTCFLCRPLWDWKDILRACALESITYIIHRAFNCRFIYWVMNLCVEIFVLLKVLIHWFLSIGIIKLTNIFSASDHQ